LTVAVDGDPPPRQCCHSQRSPTLATATGRTARRVIDSLERSYERQALSTLLGAPSRRIQWTTTHRGGGRRDAAQPVCTPSPSRHFH